MGLGKRGKDPYGKEDIDFLAQVANQIAIAVDTQMDDGTPAAGELRGDLQAAPNPNVPAASTIAAYQETGTFQYLLCKNL